MDSTVRQVTRVLDELGDALEPRLDDRPADGLGIDHVELARIGRHVPPRDLADRLAPPDRLHALSASSDLPVPTLVARLLAAKEACAKALGTGIGPELSWYDLELRALDRSPREVDCPRHSNRRLWVTSAVTRDYAVAIAACL